jgi:hypothetical protein
VRKPLTLNLFDESDDPEEVAQWARESRQRWPNHARPRSSSDAAFRPVEATLKAF